jgi:hypothetical protein
MSAALASPIARPSVGRTFIIAISVLGLVAFAQLGAVGWVFVNSFQTLTERAKVGPGRKAVADNEKNGGNLAATETTDTLEAKDPFVDGESPNATSASADPIPPPPKPVPVSPSKLNPPTAPPENRFQELLQQGKQLRDRGDTGAALTRLREAQAIDPTNPEAIAEIAVTYERMSLMDKAGEQWRRIYEMGDAAGAFYYAADARLKMSQAQALAAVNIARSSDGEGPISRLKPDANLGLGEATRVDKPESGGTRFALRIPIKTARGQKINVADVDIQVFFYDEVDGKTVVQTDADLSYRWASLPIDWTAGEPETLEVEYSRQPPLAKGPKAERREFFGYIIRLYHQGEIQDARAEPESLNAKFPVPQSLDRPSKK